MLASDVLKVAKTVLGVYLEERGEELVVGGPYGEMKAIYPKLKTHGFRFHSPTKTWRIKKDKLSPTQRSNVEGLIQDAGKGKDKAKEGAQDFIKEVKKMNHFGIEESSRGFVLKGNVFDFKNLMYDAGGRWDRGQKGYAFSYGEIDVSKLQPILDRLKREETQADSDLQEGKKEAKKLDGKSWSFVRCRVGNHGLWIWSGGYEYRSLVKDNFPRAKWESSQKEWYIPFKDVSKRRADRFLKDAESIAEKLEKETKKESPQNNYRMPSGADYVISVGEGYGGRPFKKGEVIRNKKQKIQQGEPEYLYVLSTKETYFREDGMSFGVGDESGYVYAAYCRAATDNEIEPTKKKEQERITKQEAMKRLGEIARLVSNGNFPSNASPKGKTYYMPGEKRHLIYGGGSWFVIESDGRVWYVRNNGADGDDWSRNNISTGGAGAIGANLKDEKLALEVESLFQILGIRPGL